MGIHNYDKILKASLRRVRKASMLESNREHIFNNYHFMLAKGLSKARIDHYLQVIKLFGELVKKDFADLTKEPKI